MANIPSRVPLKLRTLRSSIDTSGTAMLPRRITPLTLSARCPQKDTPPTRPASVRPHTSQRCQGTRFDTQCVADAEEGRFKSGFEMKTVTSLCSTSFESLRTIGHGVNLSHRIEDEPDRRGNILSPQFDGAAGVDDFEVLSNGVWSPIVPRARIPFQTAHMRPASCHALKTYRSSASSHVLSRTRQRYTTVRSPTLGGQPEGNARPPSGS